MSETQTSVNVQSASISESDDPTRRVRALYDDDPLQSKELKRVSYDKTINSDLRNVLELLVQEMSDFCQLKISERVIGYEKLHPLLMQLARFFQRDKELIGQMTSFLLSNHNFLHCLMLVADSTLKGLFRKINLTFSYAHQYLY